MTAMKNICKYEGKRVLLVEGKNDCHVILALCARYNVPETFGIYECGSDLALLKRLNASIIQPDAPEVVGVVLDADYPDIGARWQQVQNKIIAHGYKLPNTPTPGGTIVQGAG
ncbi:MAG: FAD-dependent oxidoreductase, partial [bacterium]|nr:FAD-dependent oxidoreductase [bacterium]